MTTKQKQHLKDIKILLPTKTREQLQEMVNEVDGELIEEKDPVEIEFLNAAKSLVQEFLSTLPNPTPEPANRGIQAGMIRVRARQAIHEGQFQDKGSVFEVDSERVKALGNLVEEVK